MSVNEPKYSKDFIMGIMKQSMNTTSQKLVNTIKFNNDISKLSAAVYSDFGFDISYLYKQLYFNVILFYR